MKPKPSANEAYTKMMELCSHSEKSAYDVRLKLIKWGLEEEADKIIEQLRTESYIDDARFARAYTKDKFRFNKWGRIKIRYMLKRLDFEKEVIDAAFSDIDPSEYRQMVFAELGKKKRSTRTNNPWQQKAKIHAFANLRGYENDLVNEFFESF